MTRIDELKAKYIKGNAKREKLYEEQSKRLDTAFMVVELREKYNLSQRELAEKAGIAKSTIARIESADMNPTVEILDSIAKAVDKELHISIN